MYAFACCKHRRVPARDRGADRTGCSGREPAHGEGPIGGERMSRCCHRGTVSAIAVGCGAPPGRRARGSGASVRPIDAGREPGAITVEIVRSGPAEGAQKEFETLRQCVARRPCVECGKRRPERAGAVVATVDGGCRAGSAGRLKRACTLDVAASWSGQCVGRPVEVLLAPRLTVRPRAERERGCSRCRPCRCRRIGRHDHGAAAASGVDVENHDVLMAPERSRQGGAAIDVDPARPIRCRNGQRRLAVIDPFP